MEAEERIPSPYHPRVVLRKGTVLTGEPRNPLLVSVDTTWLVNALEQTVDSAMNLNVRFADSGCGAPVQSKKIASLCIIYPKTPTLLT